MTAVPDANYHFVNWSDLSTENPRTDTNVTSDFSVTANFAIDTHTLTYTAGANGSITGSSSQTVDHGSDGTEVTAIPDTGYTFEKWSDNVMTASRTDTNVVNNISVSASFVLASNSDSDGVDDSIEDAAPNLGDANDDSVADSTQNNVASVISVVNSQYKVLETSGDCDEISAISSVSVDSLATQDNNHTYPAGLVDFNISCVTPGEVATITLYFYGDYDINTLKVMKFNGSDYVNISDAIISVVTIGGESAVKVTYQITDGGIYDTDGLVNGSISDPIGIGLEIVDENTGSGFQSSNCSTPFADVNSKTSQFSYICELENKGIVRGYSDGLFHPEKPVTRGQFVSAIIKAFSIKSTKYTISPFTDSIEGPHKADILTLSELGIINGFRDKTFGSETEINRAQAAKIVYKTLEFKNVKTDINTISTFSDIKEFDNFKVYIHTMQEYKIMTGETDQEFMPRSPLKRDQMTRVIVKAQQLAGNR